MKKCEVPIVGANVCDDIEKWFEANGHNKIVENKRNWINDAIMAAEKEEILIGLDMSDVLNMFRDFTELNMGIVTANCNSDATETIDALIASTQADISGCNKVYLYIKGDVSLMDVNDVAQALENRLGDDVDILFTATYDANKADKYDVLAFFIQ